MSEDVLDLKTASGGKEFFWILARIRKMNKVMNFVNASRSNIPTIIKELGKSNIKKEAPLFWLL